MKIGATTDVSPSIGEVDFGLGFMGTVPYFIDVGVMLFANKNLDIKLKSDFEYDLMITQKLFIGLGLENATTMINSVMDYSSNITVKLGYEIKKNFVPYVRYVLEKENRASKFENRVLIGLSLWI